MAYNVYVQCDACDKQLIFPPNETYSMTNAIKFAKFIGWRVKRGKDIKKTRFHCPECAERVVCE